MRVLLTTFGWPTHLHLLVPLAWAMRAAGHEVRVASHPDLLPAIQGAGLTPVTVGTELRFAARHAEVPFEDTVYGSPFSFTEERPEVLTPRYVRDTLRTYLHAPLALDFLMAGGFLDDLVAFAQQWRPDLVLWDSISYAGPLAAKVVGAAHVRVLSGIDNIARLWALSRSSGDPDGRAPSDPVAAWLGERLRPFGARFDDELVTGQATIDPLPSWMRPAIDLDYLHLPVRPVPYHGPATVPSWVDQPPRGKRVCLSMGLTGRLLADAGNQVGALLSQRGLLSEVMTAAAELDVEVVATLGPEQRAALGTTPTGVRVVDFVPLNELLPSCSAIIHHGGTGTTSAALLHGVPQLIIPNTLADETQKASAIARHGVGLACSDRVGEPRDRLRTLLEDSSFAVRARQVRDEMHATPSPLDLVPRLEKLARRHADRQFAHSPRGV